MEPGPRGLLTGDLGPQKGSMGPQGEKRAGTSLYLLPRENREDPRAWDRTDSSQAPQGRGAWTGLRAPGPCPPAEPRHLPGGSGPGRGPAGMRRAGRLLEAGILSFIDSLIPDSAGENALGPRGTSLKAWRAGRGPPRILNSFPKPPAAFVRMAGMRVIVDGTCEQDSETSLKHSSSG